MMAVRFAWGVVAMMLVGCSGGSGEAGMGVPTGDNHGDPPLTASDAGDAGDGAASSEAATPEEDAGDEADGGAAGGTLTSEAGTAFTPVYTNIYALQYGETIEVAFSNVPVTTQRGNMVILVYKRADAGTGYTLTAGALRDKTRCQEGGYPPPASDDFGTALTFDGNGRVSAGPIFLRFPIAGNYIAEFHDLTVTPSTYACQ